MRQFRKSTNMQKDFENKVRQKLSEYELPPSSQVWDDISASLAKEKKKYPLRWWGFPAVLLCLTLGLYTLKTAVFEKNGLPTDNHLGPDRAGIAGNRSAGSFQRVTRSLPVEKTWSVKPAPHLQKLSQEPVFPRQQTLHLVPEPTHQTATSLQTAGLTGTVTGQTTPLLRAAATTKIVTASGETPYFPATVQTAAMLPAQLILPADLETRAPLNPKPGLHCISTRDPRHSPSVTIALKPKKVTWSVVISGGTTNTTDHDFLFRSPRTLVYKPANSSINDTLTKMKRGYTGFHATLGIQYSNKLSRRWTLYSGLQFSFLLNHQWTGKKVVEESEIISQSVDTSYSSSKSFVKIPYHFPSGTSSDNTNSANWLEVPVGFGYTFNPAGRTTFELRAGASLAQMFGERWLVADGRYNKFYYSKALTNNTIANWHADLFVSLPGQKRIGLQIQHSITSFAKKPVQLPTYWSNVSLYTTIPLK